MTEKISEELILRVKWAIIWAIPDSVVGDLRRANRLDDMAVAAISAMESYNRGKTNMTKTTLYTGYSVADIEKMRELCTWKSLTGDFNPSRLERMRVSEPYMNVDSALVESMVQTYILAGLFPHNLVDPQ